ncbi:MAG: carbon-nitrogen hydrolase family protein [Formosimonas sp.]
MNEFPKIACVQMVSSTSVAHNLDAAARGIAQAAHEGADVVVLPEYFCLMGQNEFDKLAVAEAFSAEPSEQAQPLQHFLRGQAMLHRVYLIAGTIPLKSDVPNKVYNSTLIYAPDGTVQVRYDKIHLFGFDNGTESYSEADAIVAGEADNICIWHSPWGKIGIAICYDLRFPELFRSGGDVLAWVLTAAFTHTTGQAHWEILLRARAIENQCYVVACGQGGTHDNGRRTFGHSMIIDAWGVVQALIEDGEGVIAAPLHSSRNERVRSSLPALKHRVLG